MSRSPDTAFASEASPAKDPSPSKFLPLGTLLFLILLTVGYLVVELAFNARLLDVVGSGASNDEIHNIEVSGRLLSGVAAALVVLQILLNHRANLRKWKHLPQAKNRPWSLRLPLPSSWFAIVLCCGLTIGAVYATVEQIVDHYVDNSSAEFRRQSLNIVLIQKAIVEGRVRLAGLEDDPKLFAKPEGKVFLALFPAMAASVDKLQDKIEHAKLVLIAEHVGREAGGAQGYYDSYSKAIRRVHDQWSNYHKLRNVDSSLESTIDQRHTTAWNNYLRDLGKRGWTPSTVPTAYHDRVRSQVRKGGAPVPSHWDLTDEDGFRAAVASQVRRKVSGQAQQVKVRGQVIPPGLSFPAFVQHAAVQAELRDQLRLPSQVQVPSNIQDQQAFRRQMFEPMRMAQARKELTKYAAPISSFENNGKNAEQGLDATRAALVPPFALTFSLLGAVGHFSKLVYLLCTLVLVCVELVRKESLHGVYGWALKGVLVVVFAGTLQLVSSMNNNVTTSALYQTLINSTFRNLYVASDSEAASDTAAANAQPQGPLSPSLLHCATAMNRAQCIVHALQVAAVGQGYAYPYNEYLRVHALQGLSFGYQPQKE